MSGELKGVSGPDIDKQVRVLADRALRGRSSTMVSGDLRESFENNIRENLDRCERLREVGVVEGCIFKAKNDKEYIVLEFKPEEGKVCLKPFTGEKDKDGKDVFGDDIEKKIFIPGFFPDVPLDEGNSR